LERLFRRAGCDLLFTFTPVRRGIEKKCVLLVREGLIGLG